MSNALYDALGDITSDPMNILQQFHKFRNEMQGKNPNEEINKLLQSGKISQQQLNQAQQMAYQMRNIFK